MTTPTLPITDEQAKALQAAFEFGSQSLETTRAFGSYMAKILGTSPADLAGLLGGDWLRAKRAENLTRISAAAFARLEEDRIIEPVPVSLSLAIPFLRGAGDEDRIELVDLWARLLAAAMDPSRSHRMRRAFIDAISAMEPLDALVFQAVATEPSAEKLADKFRATRDQVGVSFAHLVEIGCADGPTQPYRSAEAMRALVPTAFGRELRAVLEEAAPSATRG